MPPFARTNTMLSLCCGRDTAQRALLGWHDDELQYIHSPKRDRASRGWCCFGMRFSLPAFFYLRTLAGTSTEYMPTIMGGSNRLDSFGKFRTIVFLKT